MFVRLGACHLSCVWRDTRYTWDATTFYLPAELHNMAISDVERAVSSVDAGLVVITGGEPALKSSSAAELARRLRAAGQRVELETSGTVALGPLAGAVDLIVVSPKLTNSGLHDHQRLRPRILRDLATHPKAVFKFVVEGVRDLEEIAKIAEVHLFGLTSSLGDARGAQPRRPAPQIERSCATSRRSRVVAERATPHTALGRRPWALKRIARF